jgi:hypothetical protein
LLLLLGTLHALPQIAPSKQLVFPRNEEIVRFERVADVPANVLSAFAKIGCQLSDARLRELPVLFFRPMPAGVGGGYVLLATCDGGVNARSFMLWQRTPRTDPEPMWFVLPNVYGEPGFAVTLSPGFLRWNAETQTLIAEQSTDMCPNVLGRTTYRLIHGVGRDARFPSWMLTKMETRTQEHCGDQGDNWKVYCEAAPWPDLPKPAR